MDRGPALRDFRAVARLTATRRPGDVPPDTPLALNLIAILISQPARLVAIMNRSLLLRLAAAALLWATTAAAAPAVGDPAPDFSLPGTDGKTHRLADYRGKKGVVLAWFPKAFTGHCTAECKSLRENSAAIGQAGVAVFAVSVDDAATNKKFAESLGLDYPVLSDPTKAAAKAYGVLNPANGLAQRWTFYIGKDGKVRHIDQGVQPSSHGQAIAEQAQKLGLGK